MTYKIIPPAEEQSVTLQLTLLPSEARALANLWLKTRWSEIAPPFSTDLPASLCKALLAAGDPAR